MAILVADNFTYQGKKPLDARLVADTLTDILALADTTIYDGIQVYNKADKKYYVYDSTNAVDATLGKWREFTAGGSTSIVDYSTLTTSDNVKKDDLIIHDKQFYRATADFTVTTTWTTDEANFEVIGKDYEDEKVKVFTTTETLSTTIADSSTYDLTLLTPSVSTADDISKDEIVVDAKGTVALITNVDITNNQYTASILTVSGDPDAMPKAPNQKNVVIKDPGTGYAVNDILAVGTDFVIVTSVGTSGEILAANIDNTATTTSTSGTGADIELEQVIFGGYSDKWAALSKAAILVSQTVSDHFDYIDGYTYDITSAGTGYAVGDVVDPNVEVSKVNASGEVEELRYSRETTISTSGSGLIYNTTTNTDVHIIPDANWNTGNAIFSIACDQGASVDFSINDTVLTKAALGGDQKLHEFTFDTVNGVIYEIVKPLAGGGSTTIVDYVTLAVGSEVKKDDIIINNKEFYRAKNNFNITGVFTNDEVNLELLSETPDGCMKEAPVSYTLRVATAGTGYTVGDVVESTTTGVFAEVDTIDTNGEILSVIPSTSTTQSASGTGAVITYSQDIYGGAGNAWYSLKDASVFNAQVVASQFEYEPGATPDEWVVPSTIWNSDQEIFTITHTSGANVTFYRNNDELVKTSVGSDLHVYEFTFDNINGKITVVDLGTLAGSDDASITAADITAAITADAAWIG